MSTKIEPTVYIVDDDRAVRNTVARWLSNEGFHARAFTAERFVAAFRPRWHGCLILDLNAGASVGLEVHEHLVRMSSTLPIIAIAGEGESLGLRTAAWSDAVDFMEKPLDEAQLLIAVGNAFARNQGCTLWPIEVCPLPPKPPRRIAYRQDPAGAKDRPAAQRPWRMVPGSRFPGAPRRSEAHDALAGHPPEGVRLAYSRRRIKAAK